MLDHAVRATADCSKPIERRHAECGRKIPVRATAGPRFTQRQPDFAHQGLRAAKKRDDGRRSFKRRAIDSSAHFQASTRQNGAQAAQFPIQLRRIGHVRVSDVDFRSRVSGNDV